MPNFRSLGQSLHINNFCKNEGGGGGGGAPIILLSEKAQESLLIFSRICLIFLQNHNDRGGDAGEGYKNLCLIFTGNGNNFKF